ncbi:MAG: discoidin domain-containing protein [Blastopirellula sp. JB062]
MLRIALLRHFLLGIAAISAIHNIARAENSPLVLVGSADADLSVALTENDVPIAIAATWEAALQQTKTGDTLVVLAEGYPQKTVDLSDEFFAAAAEKKLKVYLEYPGKIPGVEIGEPRDVQWERVVVADPSFGDDLPDRSILSMNRCRYVPISAENPILVLARVAGFDTAVYGIPKEAAPLLFHLPAAESRPELWVATSKLSHFRTARYSPTQGWQAIWRSLIKRLAPHSDVRNFTWTPPVRPTYAADSPLPADVERTAMRRGAEWLLKSGLLLTEQTSQRAKDEAKKSELSLHSNFAGAQGDGRYGMLEGFDAGILPDGSQKVRVIERSDCISETSMALAVAGETLDDLTMLQAGKNLQEYLYQRSGACAGQRGDPTHPSYGMIAWGVSNVAWSRANYGDDIARVLLATMATEAATDDHRWNPYLARGVVSNLRTTGPYGFKPARIDQSSLTKNGWKHYAQLPVIHPSGHFQSYLWACYLWAYQQSQDELLLEKSRRGIRNMMERYPDQWQWTNGLQQERARMLLPLAWLIRVDDLPEHRAWLKRIASDLIACQDESGAIREELGPLENGQYPPHHDNASFGAHEAPLIHENGEPVSDLLYTTNFAFLGLHEAAAATGDPYYQNAENKLAEFLCRIQTSSQEHPELDGAWMRAFDHQRWDYWGSNGDAGWGAFSIETGWTQGWIVAVLGFRLQETSLWEQAETLNAGNDYDKYRQSMFPDEAVEETAWQELKHAAKTRAVQLHTKPASHYAKLGAGALTNGFLGTLSHVDPQWIGIEGEPLRGTIDLGSVISLKRADLHALQSTGSGIYYPAGIKISTSEDGENFAPWISAEYVLQPDVESNDKWFSVTGSPRRGRYVQFEIQSRGTIPAPHRSAGRDAWLFVSELAINGENLAKKESK